MANSVDPAQTGPIGAVCSGSTLFAFILYLSVMLGNYLQQTTLADNIFRCIFFHGPLRVNNETDLLDWLKIKHKFSVNNPFINPVENCACFSDVN